MFTLPHLSMNARRAAVAVALACGWHVLACAAPAVVNTPAARVAPDFTLRSAAGTNLRLHEQRGQVVLLNFWANSCAPCRQVLPQLNRLHEQYAAQGLVVLGVNIDEDAANARATVERLALVFPVLLDSEKTVARAYALGALPTTVLIDRDGRVRRVYANARGDSAGEIEAQLQDLLKE